MNKRMVSSSIGLTVLAFITLRVSAQRIELESGSLAFLKGQTALNVEYVYGGLKVGDKAEEEYIQEKVRAHNNKEPGSGERWLTAWKEDRVARFQPQFEEEFNKALRRKKLAVAPGMTNATYTVIVRTLRIEPGWNAVGVFRWGRRDAQVDVVVSVVKTADRGSELARVSMPNVRSFENAFDWDLGYRVSRAYARCGRDLARFMTKNARL